MRTTLGLMLFALGTLVTNSAHAERADASGCDGVYRGKIGMQLSNRKGAPAYDAPARFVFMPDGRAGLLTAQHPDGVLTVIMKGELRGHVFFAESKGRLDYGGYHQAMTWDIRFDPKRGTATLHGKVKNLPKWARADDAHYVFRKESKP